jgi:hypothetical protein
MTVMALRGRHGRVGVVSSTVIAPAAVGAGTVIVMTRMRIAAVVSYDRGDMVAVVATPLFGAG